MWNRYKEHPDSEDKFVNITECCIMWNLQSTLLKHAAKYTTNMNFEELHG